MGDIIYSLMKNTPKIKILNTKKYGLGVFAAENIKDGTVIHMMGGTKMDIKQFIEKVNSGKENIDDPFQIGKRTYIDLDRISRTFNHNCEPNAGIRKTNEMFALKNIKAGEEITYDYSLTIAPTVWKMRCKCGSKNCRGILGDILSVPKKRLSFYKEKGALQSYIKMLLKKKGDGPYITPKYEHFLLDNLKKKHEVIF